MTLTPTRTRVFSTATARVIQPFAVALLVGAVSAAVLFALVRGVLATGGGIPLLAAVMGIAAVILVLVLRLVFRALGSGSSWLTAIAITVADLVVYLALFVTGTQKASIITLGPELVIAAVAVASGAASTLRFGGWWRVLGIVGAVALLALALTPVLVAL